MKKLLEPLELEFIDSTDLRTRKRKTQKKKEKSKLFFHLLAAGSNLNPSNEKWAFLSVGTPIRIKRGK